MMCTSFRAFLENKNNYLRSIFSQMHGRNLAFNTDISVKQNDKGINAN